MGNIFCYMNSYDTLRKQFIHNNFDYELSVVWAIDK